MQNRASLTRFAWLSIGAALATIALKTSAYLLTGSVGLLSDAIESLVNLAGAIVNFFGGMVRKVQTGLVQNYAMISLYAFFLLLAAYIFLYAK